MLFSHTNIDVGPCCAIYTLDSCSVFLSQLQPIASLVFPNVTHALLFVYVVLNPLNNCSIFDSGNNDLNNAKVQTSEFKNKPDGWETISKNEDGNVWDMSQREEDILLQEFERRIAYSKFQVCIKKQIEMLPF